MDPKTYLSNEDEEFLDEVEIETDAEYKDGHKYPEVGVYQVTMRHGNDEENVSITVKDTTSPKLNIASTDITVENGTKLTKEQFSAEDLSDVTIEIDDSNVDYSQAGTYTATVIAIDIYGNQSQSDINVTVKAKEVVETKDKEETSSTTTTKNTSTTKKTSSSSSSTTKSKSTSKNTSSSKSTTSNSSSSGTYIGNKNTKKFHKSSCSSVDRMKESNKVYNSRSYFTSNGYDACKRCNP